MWASRRRVRTSLECWLLLLLFAALIFGPSTQASRFSLLSAPFRALPRTLNPKLSIAKILQEQNIFFRGGSKDKTNKKSNGKELDATAVDGSSEKKPKRNATETVADNLASALSDSVSLLPKAQNQTKHKKRSPIRHTSVMLQNLIERSAVAIPESVTLRQLITQRATEYTEDLYIRRREDPLKKLPHPKKVLHFLAPKIPAIKHSPDVTLQIQTARSDIDSGVAACLIGTLARICEIYDNEKLLQSREKDEESDRPESSSVDLVKDRRLEQVVECLLCGVDVEKRKREYMTNYLDAKKSKEEAEGTSNDVDDILKGEEVQVREGLYIRDACRAAWGLAILGAHHCGSLGGTKVLDLQRALSMRVRELLLSRLQLVRQGDLMEDFRALDEEFPKMSPEERLYELSEELAEDAATAMWTFACVRVCTGMRSAPLFETCCSILCQDPFDIRRQAQEAESGGKQSTTIGISDVVDRLARSEDEVKDKDQEVPSVNTTKATSKKAAKGDSAEVAFQSELKTTTSEDKKEALIDWLSPNELTDVLWALALHGHSDKNAREEIVLSENAAVLREIAFDRLMVLLKEDFKLLETNAEQKDVAGEGNTSPFTEEYVTNEGETMTVEVVDAAALLASENAAKTAVVSSVENMTKQNPTGGLIGSGEQVEVVDAATILQSSSESVEHELLTAEQDLVFDDNGEQTARIEEVFTDDNNAAEPPSTATDNALIANSLTDEIEDHGSSNGTTLSEQLYFSAHDLCALAWAVTELRDSLRFQIVDLVINIFESLGQDSVNDMTGTDLANLAWAFARHSLDTRPWSSVSVNVATLPLTIWIVKRALVTSGSHIGGHKSSLNLPILDPFQPPELSRLMWAVAITIGDHADKESEYFPAVDQLSIDALVATASNLSMFSAEDMVRILWAFLQLSDLEDALAQPKVANALGSILATIETTIVRWERGRNYNRPEESETSSKEASRFAPFFLRPKLSRQMLDQIIEEYNDMEDEDEKILSSFAEEKRSKLPRLRDLGIDPATLCKLANAYARLSASHPHIRGSPTLTRVTLKLLTSKHGKLFQELSMADLTRACEAAAISDALDRGEHPVVGQFARRFIQLLNEANNSDIIEETLPNSHLKFSSASPKEISTLLWSLGELGARHFTSDAEWQTAYRKLRLVRESPLLTQDQIKHLSTKEALKALHGLVAMNVVRTDRPMLLNLLRLIEPKIPSIRQEADLCDLTESLGMIRKTLGHEAVDNKRNESSNSTRTVGNELNQTTPATNLTANKRPKDETNSTAERTANSTITTEDAELKEACDRMLSTLAMQANERVGDLKVDSVRRFLTVYSLLPFQADKLIDAFEKEVSKRQSLLEAAASTASVEDLLHEAAEKAQSANNTVFGKGGADGSSAMAVLRNGLKSIFAPAEEGAEQQSEEMQRFAEEVGELLNSVTASVTEVDDCMEQIGAASNVYADQALQRIMEGTNFELGRCRELIDNYRRIDFSTGRRRSRYDYERSRDIGKRLLSRLFPR